MAMSKHHYFKYFLQKTVTKMKWCKIKTVPTNNFSAEKVLKKNVWRKTFFVRSHIIVVTNFLTFLNRRRENFCGFTVIYAWLKMFLPKTIFLHVRSDVSYAQYTYLSKHFSVQKLWDITSVPLMLFNFG